MSGDIRVFQVDNFEYFRVQFEYHRDFGYSRRVTGELKSHLPRDMDMTYPIGVVNLILVPIQKSFDNVYVNARLMGRGTYDFEATYELEFH